jgi:predicted acetyltransferase
MAPNDLEVRKARPDDRLPIFRMLELYQHDLSDIWDQDLDAHGEYGYALDRYWTDRECHPYVAVVGSRYAGFALVDGAVKVGGSGRWMDQFFIVKKYRRHGVGRRVAGEVFATLPGPWEVGQMFDNVAAQEFWRRVIGAYTQGRFTEHTLRGGWWEGYVQCFESPASG